MAEKINEPRNCCNGDEAIYWRNEKNCAFIDSMGEMLIYADGHPLTFSVDHCPMCGRSFAPAVEEK